MFYIGEQEEGPHFYEPQAACTMTQERAQSDLMMSLVLTPVFTTFSPIDTQHTLKDAEKKLVDAPLLYTGQSRLESI